MPSESKPVAEFDKFDAVMKQVLSVSHNELNEREERWKQLHKAKKRKKSKKSSASREGV